MAFSNMLNKAIQFEVAGVPVGRGGYLAAGRGVSQTISNLFEKLQIPPILSSVAGAWAINNVSAVKNILGQAGSIDLSSVIVMEGINNQFDLTNRINSMLSSVTGTFEDLLPEDILSSGGNEETSGLEGAYSAPAVSGIEEDVGQVSDMDIYDQYMEQAQMT